MADTSTTRITKDIIWSFISTIVTGIGGILYFIIVGNSWKAEGIGLFSIVTSIYVMGSLIFNVGLMNSTTYYIAKYEEEKNISDSYATSGLFMSLILGLLAYGVFFYFSENIGNVFNNDNMTLMCKNIAPAFPFFLINKTGSGILRAHRAMKSCTILDIVRMGSLIMFFIISSQLALSIDVIPKAFIISEFLVFIIFIYYYHEYHHLRVLNIKRIQEMLQFGIQVSFSGAIGLLNQRVDILVMGMFWDATRVGIYSVASQFGRALFLISGAFQKVTSPLIVTLYKNKQNDRLINIFNTMIRWNVIIFSFLGFLMTLFIIIIIQIIYPGQPELLQAQWPFYILIPGIIAFSSIYAIGTAPSSSIGKPSNAIRILGIMFISNIVLNFLLIPRYNGNGAAFATTISMVLGVIYFYSLMKKYYNFFLPAPIQIYLWCFFIIHLVTIWGKHYISEFLLLILGVIVYIALIILLKLYKCEDKNVFLSLIRIVKRK